MSVARGLLALVLVLAVSRAVVAQSTTPGRVEFTIGARVAGTESFPAVPVTEATPGGTQRTVFVTRTRIERSVTPDVRVGVALSRGLTVEGGFSFGRATLATTIDNDIEVGSSVTVRESFHQFLVEGGLRLSPARWQRARWMPFIAAGAGHLRQLHEGRTLLETGQTIYVGGGARIFLTSPRSPGTASGLRFDVRGTLVTGGVSMDDSHRRLPVVHASYFLRF